MILIGSRACLLVMLFGMSIVMPHNVANAQVGWQTVANTCFSDGVPELKTFQSLTADACRDRCDETFACKTIEFRVGTIDVVSSCSLGSEIAEVIACTGSSTQTRDSQCALKPTVADGSTTPSTCQILDRVSLPLLIGGTFASLVTPAAKGGCRIANDQTSANTVGCKQGEAEPCTIERCKDLCLNDLSCLAMEFNTSGEVCELHTERPTQISQNDPTIDCLLLTRIKPVDECSAFAIGELKCGPFVYLGNSTPNTCECVANSYTTISNIEKYKCEAEADPALTGKLLFESTCFGPARLLIELVQPTSPPTGVLTGVGTTPPQITTSPNISPVGGGSASDGGGGSDLPQPGLSSNDIALVSGLGALGVIALTIVAKLERNRRARRETFLMLRGMKAQKKKQGSSAGSMLEPPSRQLRTKAGSGTYNPIHASPTLHAPSTGKARFLNKSVFKGGILSGFRSTGAVAAKSSNSPVSPRRRPAARPSKRTRVPKSENLWSTVARAGKAITEKKMGKNGCNCWRAEWPDLDSYNLNNLRRLCNDQGIPATGPRTTMISNLRQKASAGARATGRMCQNCAKSFSPKL